MRNLLAALGHAAELGTAGRASELARLDRPADVAVRRAAGRRHLTSERWPRGCFPGAASAPDENCFPQQAAPEGNCFPAGRAA